MYIASLSVCFYYFQDGFEFSVHICLYHVLVMQMAFYSFADGACCHTLNLPSAAWVLYSPTEYLVNSGAVCIGLATNNIVEYEAVIGLLTEATSQDVHDLVVLMDSQLVVHHLTMSTPLGTQYPSTYSRECVG